MSKALRWTYRCPECDAHLNPNGRNIVLLADCEYGKGILLFSDEPGNYNLDCPLDVDPQAGQKWEFYCPVCQANLTSEADEKISTIKLIDEEGKEHSVFFSKIAREECTFVVNAEGVETFGKHMDIYEGLIWNKFL